MRACECDTYRLNCRVLFVNCRNTTSTWTSNDMKKALNSLRNREMGINAVSRSYNISKPTLRRHLLNKNKYADGSTVLRGRATCLPHNFEIELIEHVVQLEK